MTSLAQDINEVLSFQRPQNDWGYIDYWEYIGNAIVDNTRAVQQASRAQICTSAAMEHRAMAAASKVAAANGQPQHVCMICQEMWPCKTYAHAMRWLIEQVETLPLKESGAHTHKGGRGSERLDEAGNGD